MTRIATLNCNMGLTDATGKLVNSYHNSADVAGDWHQFAHQAKDNPVNMRVIASQFNWSARYPGADGVFGKQDIGLVSTANPYGLYQLDEKLKAEDSEGKDDVTVTGTPELAENMLRALTDRTACLLQNHGTIAYGTNLDQAYDRTAQLEWMCRLWLTAASVPGHAPTLLTSSQLRAASEKLRSYGQPGQGES